MKEQHEPRLKSLFVIEASKTFQQMTKADNSCVIGVLRDFTDNRDLSVASMIISRLKYI